MSSHSNATFMQLLNNGNIITFLLCESCFWCASLLVIEKLFGLCPRCKGTSVVRMPVHLQNLHEIKNKK
jgi:hypothetical protein